MKTGLYISTLPASYRADLREAFRRRLNCRILHYDDSPLIRKCFGIVYSRSMKRLLGNPRPDVIFTSEFSPITVQSLFGRRRNGFKVVAFCDDSLDMIAGHDFGWKHRLARHVIPRYVDEIIVHSLSVRDWYQERFGKGLWMPIISDERRVRPELERVLPLSERLRPGEKPVVAFVGRLVGLKNIPTLIRAFGSMKDRAQLVIIGDGPLRSELEAMAPDALFTGMLAGDELLAWYNLIDVLVLPSTQEAYGAVTGEALMAGAKVVVSRIAGSSDLVREGENGFLFDPMDPDALSRYLGRLVEDVPLGRPLVLRENLLPYRFEEYMERLLNEINSL